MNVVCFLLFLFARKMKMVGNAVPYSNLSVCHFPGALKLEDGFAPWMVAWQAHNDPASETFTLCPVAHAFLDPIGRAAASWWSFGIKRATIRGSLQHHQA
jgi:hypothetical protein